jgi:tetratricopeptide (TPR) repeat protein
LKILDSLVPEDGDSHFRAGVMLAEHQLYAAAARQFGLARPTSKDPYLAGYNQTLAYVNAADYAAAIRTANELLNQGHETAELADVAATAYLKSGQAKEAYNAFRLAVHLDPRNEEAYVELCEMSLDHDDYDRGLQIAEIGLRHLPGSERLYLQRGIMRAMKGQFDEGEKDFAKASDLAPQEVLPAVSLGLIAMQKGNLDKAVATLRQAAARHRDSYLAQYWFAEALLRGGAEPGTKNRDQALAALKQSVRLNPNFWHARADLGKLLLDRDEVDAAISELQKAASLNPSATGPLYLLAQAYRRKGDESRAQELIAQVSKMQAEDRESLAQGGLRQLAREGKAAVPVSQGQQH